MQTSSQFEILTKSYQIIEELSLEDYKSQSSLEQSQQSRVAASQHGDEARKVPGLFQVHPDQSRSNPKSAKLRQPIQAQHQQNSGFCSELKRCFGYSTRSFDELG